MLSHYHHRIYEPFGAIAVSRAEEVDFQNALIVRVDHLRDTEIALCH